MVSLTSCGRVFQLLGPALLKSCQLTPRCSGWATTKPARASVAASVCSGRALPAVPCDKTISARLSDAAVESAGKGAALLAMGTVNAP